MQNFCKGIKAKFMILYIPDYFQVYYTTLPGDEKASYEKKYDMNKPQDLLRSFCGKNNIVFLDATPFLQKEANKKHLYYDSDQHFTKVGHGLVADVINDRLKKLGIVAGVE